MGSQSRSSTVNHRHIPCSLSVPKPHRHRKAQTTPVSPGSASSSSSAIRRRCNSIQTVNPIVSASLITAPWLLYRRRRCRRTHPAKASPSAQPQSRCHHRRRSCSEPVLPSPSIHHDRCSLPNDATTPLPSIHVVDGSETRVSPSDPICQTATP
ncbi:hypothetical protein M0R45_026188 [Rubus argutus]|uniref:Uncharacterized protein n=1 Tax=Rubus argutus TaxID=59490 RepID=A0AAW1WWU3_RUBAR